MMQSQQRIAQEIDLPDVFQAFGHQVMAGWTERTPAIAVINCICVLTLTDAVSAVDRALASCV